MKQKLVILVGESYLIGRTIVYDFSFKKLRPSQQDVTSFHRYYVT